LQYQWTRKTPDPIWNGRPLTAQNLSQKSRGLPRRPFAIRIPLKRRGLNLSEYDVANVSKFRTIAYESGPYDSDARSVIGGFPPLNNYSPRAEADHRHTRNAADHRRRRSGHAILGKEMKGNGTATIAAPATAHMSKNAMTTTANPVSPALAITRATAHAAVLYVQRPSTTAGIPTNTPMAFTISLR
jgi:hypothetical protein